MILEVTPENLRDIAAAVSAARKRAPGTAVLDAVEARVLGALRRGEDALELADEQAQALRNALLLRAWDQRDNTEGYDYSDLADRIRQALEDLGVRLDEA